MLGPRNTTDPRLVQTGVTVEEGLERLTRTVEEAAAHAGDWRDRVRAGLVALLGFLDDEPDWARLLLLEAPLDDVGAFLREQRTLGVLTTLLDDGSPQAIGEVTLHPELTAELVAGGVFAVIRAHVLDERDRPLVELAPSLMAFLVAPYLGQGAAQAELAGTPAPEGEGAVSVS